MNQEIATNKNQTAQQELLSALADVFNGKQYRYWKKDDELWFVAKDIVEAAGGTWDNGNFRKVVGEGGVQYTPLEINGISQNVLACTDTNQGSLPKNRRSKLRKGLEKFGRYLLSKSSKKNPLKNK